MRKKISTVTVLLLIVTVAKVTKSDFTVSIIPHTAGETTLLLKSVGDPVNLENDIVGKYVEKLLGLKNTNVASQTAGNSGAGNMSKGSGLTMETLADFLA